MTRIDNKKDIKKKKGSNKKVKDKKVEIVNDNKTKEKELYTSKEVIIVMIFSIGIGILMCFGGISIITGKNYLAVTKDLKKVVDTYYAIVDNYYGELDRDKLIDGAVEGMISSVGDTFTSYSDTESTSSFDETINGSYEGIGCTVATLEDGTISVIDMFDDSPSYKAGLKVGDVILKVDGESYEGKNSNDISNYIKNSGKSKIVLTVKRNNEEKDISINLSKVEIPHVSGKVIEQDNKKIGYIKISLFASNSYKQFKNKLDELEKSNIDDLIIDVRDKLTNCSICGNITENDICDICSDSNRNSKIVFVVEKAKDISLFEKINIYNGKYHVLGGLISPLEGIGPDDVNISCLISRIDKENIEEIILALKPSIEGETTMQYIKKILENKNIKITRIATGIPMGTDIDYIDAMTLEFALEGRKDI